MGEHRLLELKRAELPDVGNHLGAWMPDSGRLAEQASSTDASSRLTEKYCNVVASFPVSTPAGFYTTCKTAVSGEWE